MSPSFFIKAMRKVVLMFWLLLLGGALIFYALNPTFFSVENLTVFFKNFKTSLILGYILVSILRGVFLLPSTPFVLAGLVLFPDDRFLVFALSLFCIGLCSALIYFFADYLRLGDVFGEKYAVQKEKISEKMSTPYGMAFVVAWSFFPIVPTDLVCYVAGSIKMSFLKFMIAVLIGEALICGFYVFLSNKYI